MDYFIRRMTIDDYDGAHRLWTQTEGLSLEEDDTRDAIEIYLDRNEGFCFVAVSGSRIIGTALCGHEGRRGTLRHLAVESSFRGKGIARSLVNACLSALANVGIAKCNTFVLDANVEGRRFWKHMGWYVLEDNYRTLQIPTSPNFIGEKMEKIFDGKKTAKLGTEKNPAVVHVKTKKRMKEVASIFEKNGWKYTIELESKKPEDITDLEILLNWPKPVEVEKKVGRNEPCPCGSGKKYKKCCGK